MSPSGDTLRTRCRSYPGLVNSTTIDWMFSWPEQALLAVANVVLRDVSWQSEPIRGGGGGGKVNSVKKSMFLRIFFGDTDSVSLFSRFPYNNATFEQYFPGFSLQNIENQASDSKSPEAPRKKVVLMCTS